MWLAVRAANGHEKHNKQREISQYYTDVQYMSRMLLVEFLGRFCRVFDRLVVHEAGASG